MKRIYTEQRRNGDARSAGDRASPPEPAKAGPHDPDSLVGVAAPSVVGAGFSRLEGAEWIEQRS